MNNLKRISILMAIFATIIVVSVSYEGNDILARAIVLGIGIDLSEDGQLSVTTEIVSPGNGSDQQVGTFSKTVTATGATVAQALQSIAEKCGKETSLGQCVLLVYGENFLHSGFSSTSDYFIKSDSFKESAIVCCCQGQAKELLNQADALSQSVSLALADKLKGLSKDVAIPSCDLLTFSRSQTELYQTGFLNYVRFEKSENTDPQSGDKEQGYFVFDRVAVFRNYNLVGVLTEEETKGFALLNNNVSGNTFVVDEKGETITLRANTKDVDLKQQDGTVKISVDLQVKTARTDSFGAGGKFTAKTESEISAEALEQAKQQALALAQLYLQKQVEWEFDLIQIHEAFRQQHGTTEQVVSLQMKEIQVELNVSIKEK